MFSTLPAGADRQGKGLVRLSWAETSIAVMLAALLAALCVVLAWLWMRGRRRSLLQASAARSAAQRLEIALAASGGQFWEMDLSRAQVRRLSPRAGRAPSEPAAGLYEEGLEGLVHPDDAAVVRERLIAHLRGQREWFTSEHRVRSGNGWEALRVRGLATAHDASGRALQVSGIASPVGSALPARAEQIAVAVQQNMSEAVCVLTPDFVICQTNPAFQRITGYANADIVGRGLDVLDSPQHDPAFYEAIRREVRAHGKWSGEAWARRKDGEEFLCATSLFTLGGHEDATQPVVVVFSDITHTRRAEQELRYLANFDALTNLPNRALLSERLAGAIVRARREHGRIAVLFIDLDHFKDVNDSLGHAAGDRILRAVATRLQDTVGAGRTVARIGGDEFTVVQEGIASPEDADRLAREISMAFDAPLLLDDRVEVSLSPSIGISLYPEHGLVPTELLKRADTAMYQAKDAGRRTFCRYDDSMEVALRHRAQVSAALRKVLDRGEMRLVYQPRLSLPQQRIVGVEALLRWHSAEHGEVPPAQFIPLAEESGLILELGEWVLREACLTLRRWQQHGLDGLSMSVNVSALQLLRGDFPLVVDRVLSDTGVAPGLLELELTESVVMANAAITSGKLHAFRRSGVSLAIDDFGTGYSSLAYLRRLPITTLKIDKEFIGDLSNDPDDASITTTVITMAHSLGLNVVAEGVETAEQLEFLRLHGCDEIQGYWLSRPLDPDACLAFLRDWRPGAALAGAT